MTYFTVKITSRDGTAILTRNATSRADAMTYILHAITSRGYNINDIGNDSTPLSSVSTYSISSMSMIATIMPS